MTTGASDANDRSRKLDFAVPVRKERHIMHEQELGLCWYFGLPQTKLQSNAGQDPEAVFIRHMHSKCQIIKKVSNIN